MDIPRIFWRDGFVILRGLFTPAEVLSMREEALGLDNLNLDLLSIPGLRGVLLDDRLLDVVRSLIGDHLVYFGDSSVWRGTAVPGFHKDNPDKFDSNAPDWKGRYPLVRFGIYTQSHKGKPDGLDLRRGSHEHCSIEVGEHVYAETEPGDVVIWNLRTTHSGGGMTLGGRPINPNSVAASVLRKLRILHDKPQATRVALFGTFGAPSTHLERNIAYCKTRRFAVDMFLAQRYDTEALSLARMKGVEVRDMKAEATALDPSTVHVLHRELPY